MKHAILIWIGLIGLVPVSLYLDKPYSQVYAFVLILIISGLIRFALGLQAEQKVSYDKVKGALIIALWVVNVYLIIQLLLSIIYVFI